MQGAITESPLRELLSAARGRKLELVVADSTKVFLTERGPAWYRGQGLAM